MKETLNSVVAHRGDVTRREVVWVGALAIVIALLLNAPMVPRMTDSMPEVGFGDPYLTAWMVAWDGHAVAEQPTAMFDANTFWPWRNSLAFSDALLGYTPAGLFGEGFTAAIVRHNILYLFAHAFAFLGAYLLARQLGVGPLAALVAGVVFAFAPWRLDQRTHLHVLSSGGVPLTIFLFTRGFRNRSPNVIVVASLVAIWQISIGFTLGIPLGYVLGAVGLIALFLHRRYGTEPLGRPVIVATVCSVLIMGAWVTWQAAPYYRVVDAHPEARRTTEQVRFFSSPMRGLVTAPRSNLVWGETTEPMRASLRWPTEQALFPGLGAIVLAGLGLFSRRSLRIRILLGIGTFACMYLAMGYAAPGGSVVYGVLYDIAPGWQGIRVPGRLMTFASLGLGSLAAFGCQKAVDRLAEPPDRPLSQRAWVAAAIPMLLLLEGAGTVEVKDVPTPPSILSRIDGPRVHVPTNDLTDRVYMLWSVDRFEPIANGESGFLPESVAELRTRMPSFPDAESVALLRQLEVETVVFHPDMVGFELSVGASSDGVGSSDLEGSRAELERMLTADITGLGLTREVGDDTVIFRLEEDTGL